MKQNVRNPRSGAQEPSEVMVTGESAEQMTNHKEPVSPSMVRRLMNVATDDSTGNELAQVELQLIIRTGLRAERISQLYKKGQPLSEFTDIQEVKK